LSQILIKEESTSPERRQHDSDELNNIAVELKRLGGELKLSDEQKDKLKTFLTEKYESNSRHLTRK
jgi:hypothetical protein